jgi:tetratricopeptide (TPR) repeat protein
MCLSLSARCLGSGALTVLGPNNAINTDTDSASVRRHQPMDTFFLTGNAMLNKGNLEQLLPPCEKQLAQFPADSGAWWLLKGNIYYRKKEWNHALLCLRKADELQPGWAVEGQIADLEARIRESKTRDLKVVTPVTAIDGSTTSETSGLKDDA